MTATTLDSRVHHELLEGIVRTGHAPSVAALAGAVGVPSEEVALSLRRLHDGHALVLHPGTVDIWVAQPFSMSPTAVWVATGADRGFWAPCLWCAMGIVTLAAPTATIHVRLAGEAEETCIRIDEGRLVDDTPLVHFAIPARAAWSNVLHFCATVRPFRHEQDVDRWCARHGLPRGVCLPMAKVLELGRAWYGPYRAPDWRKWTAKEAQAIFANLGLTGDFWQLPAADDRPF
jgi:hypothetical protein